MAKDLRWFWVTVIALNRFATDIVSSVNGDRTEMKQAMVVWRAQQEDNDDTATLQAFRHLTGTQDDILSDEQAIDVVFDCDGSEPRFRPGNIFKNVNVGCFLEIPQSRDTEHSIIERNETGVSPGQSNLDSFAHFTTPHTAFL